MASHASPTSRGSSTNAVIVERPGVAMVSLRADAADRRLVGRVNEAIGQPLPTMPNRFLASLDQQCIWLGPDEWLIVGPAGSEASLVDELDRRLESIHHSVTDVTGTRIVLHVRGNRAAELLSIGCSLDLDSRTFAAGNCAHTLLARVPVSILALADDELFDVHVPRSYVRYLAAWLMHAAAQLD